METVSQCAASLSQVLPQYLDITQCRAYFLWIPIIFYGLPPKLRQTERL